MSKFERIATFISVVEEHGFAAAARKKEVSTAAISRQVSALEEELGTQLLHRTTRKLSLTEIGKEYYQQCKKVVDGFQEAEMAIAESKSEATGMLQVMANRYFAIHFLLPKLPEFTLQNPQLQINLQLAERVPNLEEEGIDILFGLSIEGSPELVRRRIASTRYVLCASPEYLKKHGAPKTPHDLSKHHYITHSGRKPDNVVMLKNEMEIQVNPHLRLNDSFAMCLCAREGMGIINVHDYMVTDALKTGQLIEVLKEYQEPQKNVYLFYRQSRYLQSKIRRFIDFYTA